MPGIDLPLVSLNIIAAQQTAGVTEQRVLIIGQLLPAGTATGGDLQRDFPNDGSEDTLFGATSHVAGLVRAFKRENKVSNLDVIGLADAAGTQATGVITFAAGAAGADTTIQVSIGSEKDFTHEITVTSGDTITDIADAVTAAFLLDTKAPFVVANVAGVVTATAENDGTLSNEWGISVVGVIDSVTIAITAWTGGATDPVLTSVLDVIGDTRYQTILWPESYDLDVVQTLLDARFNVTNGVQDGVVIQVKVDTLSNLKTYANQNSESVVIPAQKKIVEDLFKGSATLEMPDIACAEICAIRALRLTLDAVLTPVLTTVAPGDQFGGIELASLPYFNTSLPNLPIATAGHVFSEVDLAELQSNGLATYGPNKAFNNTIFGEFVTTYLTDGAGNPDTSFKFLNTVDTISAIREFYFNNIKVKYAQTLLTDSDLIARRDMANASSIRAFMNELYDILADNTLTQKGTAAKKDYNQNLSIIVDVSAGKVTIDQAPLLVSQLRVIIGTIQVNFGG